MSAAVAVLAVLGAICEAVVAAVAVLVWRRTGQHYLTGYVAGLIEAGEQAEHSGASCPATAARPRDHSQLTGP